MSEFVLVPKVPTSEMFRAAGAAWEAPGCQRVIEIVWPRLLDASPTPHLFDELVKALQDMTAHVGELGASGKLPGHRAYDLVTIANAILAKVPALPNQEHANASN